MKQPINKIVYAMIVLAAFTLATATVVVLKGQAMRTATAQEKFKTPAKAEPALLTSAEIQAAFGQIPKTSPSFKNVVEQEHYTVAVARLTNRNGGPEFHRDSDRVFFIKEGKAVMRVGGEITDPKEIAPGEIRSASGEGYKGYREVTLEPGSILSAPRGTTYQLVAKNSDISFIVVRIR